MSIQPPPSLEAEVQHRMTALVFRNAPFTWAVHLSVGGLLAWVNVTQAAPIASALAWWALVAVAATVRYGLALGFAAAAPDAYAAMIWRRRYVLATALVSAAWGAGVIPFVWHGSESVQMFTGLVVGAMVAGALPLLAAVPAALWAFVVLAGLPMTAAILFRAGSSLQWAFGFGCLIFLVYMLAGARHLQSTLGASIRLGLEQKQLAGALEQALAERKDLEEAHRRDRDFAEGLIDTAQAIVIVLDPEGRILRINRFMEELSGYAQAELQNADWFALFPPEAEREGARVRYRNALAEGRSTANTSEILTRDGRRILVEWHDKPMRDAGGAITGILALGQDVTEREAAEERLALALRGSDLAIADWHVPSGTLVFGEGWTKLLGYQPGDLLDQTSTLRGLLNPRDIPAARRALIRHLKGEVPHLEAEVRMRHKDGRWIWVQGRATAVERDANGRAVRVTGTAKNITHRKEAEAEISRLSQWNEMLLASAGQGIYSVDLEGRCTYLNATAARMLGYAPEEILGARQHDLFHTHHMDGSPYPAEDCPVSLTLGDGIRRESEDAFVRKNGEMFPVQLTVTPMHEKGSIVGVVAVFEDITQRKAMEEELRRLATTDPLTGVANRRRFLQEMDMELARHKRFGKPSSFLMLDIDHFKRVNDAHGHAAGDLALRHLAELSRIRLRRLDLFGRLGGEEFGILLPGTDGAGAMTLAELFRAQVEHSPVQTEAGSIPLTVSIGLTVFTPGDAEPDSILARADAALYRAKENGRNRVEMG